MSSQPSSLPRLSIRNLSIGNQTAFVRDVSFDVGAGRILALVANRAAARR